MHPERCLLNDTLDLWLLFCVCTYGLSCHYTFSVGERSDDLAREGKVTSAKRQCTEYQPYVVCDYTVANCAQDNVPWRVIQMTDGYRKHGFDLVNLNAV